MAMAYSPSTGSSPQLAAFVDHYSPGRSRIRLCGELDLVTAAQAGAVFADVFRSGARFVDVDVSGLTFCDAAGLRALTEAHLRWRSVSGRLLLRQVGPGLVRLLRITGLDETLIVEPPLASPRVDGTDPSRDQRQHPTAGHSSGLHQWSSHLHGADRVAALRAELSHDPALDRPVDPASGPPPVSSMVLSMVSSPVSSTGAGLDSSVESSLDSSMESSLDSSVDEAPVVAESSTLSARLFADRAEIRVAGELSVEVRGHLDDVVGWLIETGNTEVVIEIEDLDRMDRTSLEALFDASSRLRRAGGRLSLSFGELRARVLDPP
jgi:anti-sigma B factor antagonist